MNHADYSTFSIDDVITDAHVNAAAYRYLAENDSHVRKILSAPQVARVFKELDFENPPVDLKGWYVQWFHYVKTSPSDFEHLADNLDNAATMLVTLGLAVGYSMKAEYARVTAPHNSSVGDLDANEQNMQNKAKLYGKRWLAAATGCNETIPKHIIAMLHTIMPHSPASVSKYGKHSGASHALWTECFDADVSAFLFKTIFSGNKAAVIDLVVDMHDDHWQRCEVLSDIFSQQQVETLRLPENISSGY